MAVGMTPRHARLAETRGGKAPIFSDGFDPPSSSLPDWVPAPGELAVLTQGNGRLVNHFRSQCAAFYEPFYFVKIVNDYSGAFKNPYWGRWGATVFFGGGHAATNDNSVVVAEYGDSAITFKRVSSPTAWFGGTEGVDPGPIIRSNNSNANIVSSPPLDLTCGEATIDGQQCSPHSCACGDIVGPEHGGGRYGSLVTIATGTFGRGTEYGAMAAHHVDFDTLELQRADGSYRIWRRLSDARPPTGWGAARYRSTPPSSALNAGSIFKPRTTAILAG